MTLISSYGGITSNSYIDATQANSFIRTSTLDNDDWFELTLTQKQAALMMASRDIDSRQYIGHRYYFDQALEFPRQLRSAFPFNRTSSTTVSQDTIQRRMQENVQKAAALQALKIARQGGRNQHLENIANGITGISESVGPIREFVQYGQVRAAGSSAKFDPQALALLQEWMTSRKIYRK
jgi:hypothetical protein